MWAFFNFGFCSAVARKPKDILTGDNRTLQIRARDPKHLDQLRDRYMGDELGPTVVFENTDYQCRAYCTPEAWGRALYAAAQDITYDNFKASITDDNDLHDAALGVWTALAAQYGTNYGSFTSSTKGGKYQSAFGHVKNFDRVVSDWDDVDHTSEDKINKLMETYLPPPMELSDVLTAREVREYLRVTNRMFREFLSANSTWKSFRSIGGRYEFPKSKLMFLEEDFNIWQAEKLERESEFTGQ